MRSNGSYSTLNIQKCHMVNSNLILLTMNNIFHISVENCICKFLQHFSSKKSTSSDCTLTSEMELVLSYLSCFMLNWNRIIIFCRAGWEANLWYETNCRKQRDGKFFLFQKELCSMLMPRKITFYMPLTLTNLLAWGKESQEMFPVYTIHF